MATEPDSRPLAERLREQIADPEFRAAQAERLRSVIGKWPGTETDEEIAAALAMESATETTMTNTERLANLEALIPLLTVEFEEGHQDEVGAALLKLLRIRSLLRPTPTTPPRSKLTELTAAITEANAHEPIDSGVPVGNEAL